MKFTTETQRAQRRFSVSSLLSPPGQGGIHKGFFFIFSVDSVPLW